MEDIIKLKSKGGINNYLRKLKKTDGSESKTYILRTDITALRTGYIDDKFKYIFPHGGPRILEGEFLEEAGAIVDTITFMQDFGHVVTFK